MSEPLLQFKSHIEGRNADVAIYPDRIEWSKDSTSKGKVALGIMTAGASLLATGVKGKEGSSEIIPVKSISSVTSNKDGFRFTKVSVICSGNTIDFRVGHDEAKGIKDILTQLMLGSHPTQQNGASAAAPSVTVVTGGSAAASSDDITEQLKKLGDLRDAGILTTEEFDAKKAELLARM